MQIAAITTVRAGFVALAATLALPACAPATPEEFCSGEMTRSRMEEYVRTTRLNPQRAHHQDIVKDVELELRDPAVQAYDANTKLAVCNATVTLIAPDGYVLTDEHGADVKSRGERQFYRVQPAANGDGLLIDWRYYEISSLRISLEWLGTAAENEAYRRGQAEAAAERRRREAESTARFKIEQARRDEEMRQAQAESRQRFMVEVNEARARYQPPGDTAAIEECNRRRRDAYDAAGGGVAGSQAVRALPRCQ